MRSLDLFGSVARNEAHLGSDVDVLVGFIASNWVNQVYRNPTLLRGFVGL